MACYRPNRDRIAFLYRVSFNFLGAKHKKGPPKHNKPKHREKEEKMKNEDGMRVSRLKSD